MNITMEDARASLSSMALDSTRGINGVRVQSTTGHAGTNVLVLNLANGEHVRLEITVGTGAAS